MLSQDIRYLLFDLDGTLINTNELIMQSFQHALQAYGLTVPEEEVLRQFGKPLADQFRLFAPAQVEELVACYRQFNWQHHDLLTTDFPGVDAALQELQRRGYQMAIVTSKSRPVVRKGLALFDLTSYFAHLVCSEDTLGHKPGPEPVIRALQLLGAESHQAAMIGDSPYDLLAAKAAGVAAVGVLWSSFSRQSLLACKPDYLLTSPHELLQLFPEFN